MAASDNTENQPESARPAKMPVTAPPGEQRPVREHETSHSPTEAPPRPRRGAPHETAPPRRAWYRRTVPLLTAVIFTIGILIAVGLWWWNSRKYVSADDAFIQGHIIRVAPQVAGRVLSVPVHDNQDVEAGQLLVQIDPADFRVRLAQAQAALGEARGRLDQSQAGVAAAQAQAQAARADVTAAQAKLNSAQAELQRSEGLPAGAIAPQQLQNLRSSAEAAQAQVTASQKAVAAADAQAKLAQSRLQTDRASIAAAEAGIQRAELDLSYTHVVAAEAGRVTEKTVQPGNYVQIGQSTMALVPRRMWVIANFKETDLNLIRPGQPATISIDAYGGRTVHGKVDSIQRGAGAAFSLLPPENATGNYVKVVQRVPVKIVFTDDPEIRMLLGPGMSVVPSVRVRQ